MRTNIQKHQSNRPKYLKTDRKQELATQSQDLCTAKGQSLRKKRVKPSFHASKRFVRLYNARFFAETIKNRLIDLFLVKKVQIEQLIKAFDAKTVSSMSISPFQTNMPVKRVVNESTALFLFHVKHFLHFLHLGLRKASAVSKSRLRTLFHVKQLRFARILSNMIHLR